jgi:glucokinase
MYLGIEIGGTKLQFGLGPGDGTLRAFKRLPVDVGEGAAGIREQILRTVPALLREHRLNPEDVSGLGFGFGGPVDDHTRRVLKSHQIAGWADFPLAEWAERSFGWPAALGNDADVAGLAEAHFGAGQGVSPLFYVTIGSGVGGGLILNGEIYRGCGRGAAEVGHLTLCRHADDEAAAGPLEEAVSGWAIGRRAQAALWTEVGHGSVLRAECGGPGASVTARQVADAACRGDGFALALLHQVWTDLALGLRQVIVLLCPRRIVIGGGVSLMGEEFLFQPLREIMSRSEFAPFAGCTDIVPAALGEEVVVHGALALARRRLGRSNPVG